jgi:hypothetical protein
MRLRDVSMLASRAGVRVTTNASLSWTRIRDFKSGIIPANSRLLSAVPPRGSKSIRKFKLSLLAEGLRLAEYGLVI